MEGVEVKRREAPPSRHVPAWADYGKNVMPQSYESLYLARGLVFTQSHSHTVTQSHERTHAHTHACSLDSTLSCIPHRGTRLRYIYTWFIRSSSNHIRVFRRVVQSHSCISTDRPITFVYIDGSSNHVRVFRRSSNHIRVFARLEGGALD